MGFFGDSLLRKFDAEPPDEWVAAINALSDFQLERGLKRLLFSWKGAPPNLPDFMRLCRAIGDEFDDGPKPKALAAPDTWKGDHWDITANIKFWKYITHRLTESYRPWGAAWTEEHAACTRIAVAYKNAWAQDMREYADEETGEVGKPPQEYGDRMFADCMRRAEADIAAYRLEKAA